MKTTALPLIALLFLITSCSTYRLSLPERIEESSIRIHVRGANKSIFRHKIKMDGFATGSIKAGFGKIREKERRLYPIYYDLNKTYRTISNNFSRTIYKSSSKFRTTIDFNGVHTETLCAEKENNNGLRFKQISLTVELTKKYDFDAIILNNKESSDKPWRLSFSTNRNLLDDAAEFVFGTNNVEGLLTNDSIAINVKPIRIDHFIKNSTTRKNIPFKEFVGYQFDLGQQTIGFVDVYGRNVWINKEVDDSMKALLLSASISILAKS